MIYYRNASAGGLFEKAYQLVERSSATVFRLGADTTYEFVGVSLLTRDMESLGIGTLNTTDFSIGLLENENMTIPDISNIDYGVRVC